jgi:hypothetical protein
MHRLYLVYIIIIIILSTDPHTATFVKEFDIYPRKSIFSISAAKLTTFCHIPVARYSGSSNTTYEFCKIWESNFRPADILL